MISNNLKLITISSLICISVSVQAQTFSPGIIIEEETGQVLYEGTAGIIYSFQSPIWENFLTFQIYDAKKGLANCRNSSHSQFCDIFDQFISISGQIQDAVQPATFRMEETTMSSTWGLKCHYLSQHFSSFRVDSSIIMKYLGFLRSCPNMVLLEEAVNTEYASHPSLQYFHDAKTIFEQDFFPSGSGVHLNFLDSLLSTGFTSFLSQSIRWSGAISHCKSGHIPDSLITPEMLHRSLTTLDGMAAQNGYKFVISPDPEFIPVYFKNKFADCTFSEGKLYVRILVPVVKMDRNWSHISVNPIQFYDGDQGRLYQTGGETGGQYFYESGSKRLFRAGSCNKNQPEFCRMPELWDQSVLINVPNCVTDVLQGFSRSANCSGEYASEEVGSLPHMPIVSRQGSDTYYLTDFPSKSVKITCQEPDGSELIQNFPFPEVKGVLKIMLPCFCVITSGDIELWSSPPCQVLNSRLNVTEVWHQDFV